MKISSVSEKGKWSVCVCGGGCLNMPLFEIAEVSPERLEKSTMNSKSSLILNVWDLSHVNVSYIVFSLLKAKLSFILFCKIQQYQVIDYDKHLHFLLQTYICTWIHPIHHQIYVVLFSLVAVYLPAHSMHIISFFCYLHSNAEI